MGYEYFIEHKPEDLKAWERFTNRLENPTDGSGWTAFSLETCSDGIYFCDHGRSPAAAVALRRVLDEALSCRGAVTIREL